MKNNAQRCKNCVHKCVCPYQEHFANLDGIEKCKHYYPKWQAKERGKANGRKEAD